MKNVFKNVFSHSFSPPSLLSRIHSTIFAIHFLVAIKTKNKKKKTLDVDISRLLHKIAHNHEKTADDNSGITKSNELCFIDTKSPSLLRLHHHHHHHHQRQAKSSLGDVVMHFSPPSKDSVNTDFNAISESGRNSVSRQSLIGEFTLVASFYMWKEASSALRTYVFSLSLTTHKRSSFAAFCSHHQFVCWTHQFYFVSCDDCAVLTFVNVFVCGSFFSCSGRDTGLCMWVLDEWSKRSKSLELSLMIHDSAGCKIRRKFCSSHNVPDYAALF